MVSEEKLQFVAKLASKERNVAYCFFKITVFKIYSLYTVQLYTGLKIFRENTEQYWYELYNGKSLMK